MSTWTGQRQATRETWGAFDQVLLIKESFIFVRCAPETCPSWQKQNLRQKALGPRGLIYGAVGQVVGRSCLGRGAQGEAGAGVLLGERPLMGGLLKFMWNAPISSPHVRISLKKKKTLSWFEASLFIYKEIRLFFLDVAGMVDVHQLGESAGFNPRGNQKRNPGGAELDSKQSPVFGVMPSPSKRFVQNLARTPRPTKTSC